MRTPLFVACLAAALAGCAGDIRPDDFGQSPPMDALVATGAVTTRQNPDGTFTTIIDATSLTQWTHLDFETRGEAAAGPWDLRYQRFHISANGGITGSGGVEVVPISERLFDEVTAVPSTGWLTDAPDGEDANLDPDYAFEQGDGWYSYDFDKHTLTPRPLVWVVRSNGGGTFKLRFERYYDTAGTPGWISLRWMPL
jgi:hypothetical protein